MYYYSKRSLDRLFTCDARQIKLWMEVIKYLDCTILWGYRNEEEQNALYNATPRKSSLVFPESSHNIMPSLGCDVQPFPLKSKDVDNRELFMFFRGQVDMVARQLGIYLKPAIVWDLYHFEVSAIRC